MEQFSALVWPSIDVLPSASVSITELFLGWPWPRPKLKFSASVDNKPLVGHWIVGIGSSLQILLELHIPVIINCLRIFVTY